MSILRDTSKFGNFGNYLDCDPDYRITMLEIAQICRPSEVKGKKGKGPYT